MSTKILIAEDDKFLANAYRVKFEKEEFTVLIAYDGEEAIEAVKSFKPDVILLDLVMPKMDGFATLEALKKDPATKDIKVIVASNLGQAEDVERARKLGALDYVVKSDTPIAEIVAKIKSV